MTQINLFSDNEIAATAEVGDYEFEPIKGYPMLRWKGKRFFRNIKYYPAQLKEKYGRDKYGWLNEIFWGDNLQVMSHLLKKYRGKVKLVYIDPPFDSKAQYKKTIKVQSKTAENDSSVFEEKQYNDMWANDEYLQFMYERLILIRELLADEGSLYVHSDWHKSHYLRLILDEIFGAENFRNEIIWVRSTNPKGSQHDSIRLSPFTDTIFYYVKTSKAKLHLDRVRIPLTQDELLEKYHRKDENGRLFYDGPILRSEGMGARDKLVYAYKGYTPGPEGWRMKRENLEKLDKIGNLGWSKTGKPFRMLRPEDDRGKPVGSFWNDISLINSQAEERLGYPTQKPIKLLERIILLSSDPGDIVFDCFMGSGTTQAAAMGLGRRFIGADINLGAIQTTTKRLVVLGSELDQQTVQLALSTKSEIEEVDDLETDGVIRDFYTGFTVYNVNHYDVFRNPTQARDLLMEALEIQPFPNRGLYDGEKDGRMVKIMPVDRIATRADLNELITGFDYKVFERRKAAHPNESVERLLLICMGHEPDLKAGLQSEVDYKLDVEIVDILREEAHLEFKRESEGEVAIDGKYLVIKRFYPMNLLQKLSIMKESVDDWRQLVESIMVDWNYDGVVLEPAIVDVPDKHTLVDGSYLIPNDAGTIRVKITDLLSESFYLEVQNG